MKETQLQEAIVFAQLLLGFALLLVTYLTTQLSLNMRDHVLFPRDEQRDGGASVSMSKPFSNN